MKRIIFILLFSCSLFSQAQQSAPNLILVTIDGVRWQEVFYGLDDELLADHTSTSKPQALSALFKGQNVEESRELLMPFLWQKIAAEGVILGDRKQNSNMRVANPWYFSYPGYNEVITGHADPSIDSNEKHPNPNVSFLEWLQTQPGFKPNLAVFGSWDVFPAIFNRERSQLHINAGFEGAEQTQDAKLAFLNELQKQIPSPWSSVRFDAFTYQYAKAYLQTRKPRAMMLALGEPDDYAHNRNYDEYIKGIHRADNILADLWQTLQSLPQYKDNTYLLITTDHGRGMHREDWTHHSSKAAIEKNYPTMLEQQPNGIVGSEQIWFAAIGPKITAKGLIIPKQEQTLAQVTATALLLLGQNPDAYSDKIAQPIEGVVP
ncbi:alkaline phosphatase family protein [Pseudoalteromonas piscicida]|uniref:alkaline phosphatase family protein n=1 Tax=Pseudoalteromonas piscicida TaxID=43662 RepID=UPI0030A92B08